VTRSRRAVDCVLVVAALASMAGPAAAQPDEAAPPPDAVNGPSTEEQAAAAFDLGKRAFLEDDYTRALASFEEAQRLEPHDVVRFNIALCQERLGHFRIALGEYEHAAASEQLDEANRTEAAERAERVRARLGTVVIDAPAGAAVEVVGVETCTAPCRIDVDPGSYDVRRVDQPQSPRSVTVARGEQRAVDWAPAPRPPIQPPPRRHGARLHIGIVGFVGAGAVILGTVGTIGFGLRAESLHARYLDEPTVARRDSGRTAVVLTDVSLTLAVLGAAALLVDVLVLQRRTEPAPDREALAFAF